MPKTNQPEDLSARDAASQPEEQPQADAPAEEKKPDLFDYLESQPDVEDPFPPSEPEPEPEEPTDTELLARYIRTRSAQGQLTARKALLEENPEMEPVIDELLQDEAFPDIRTEKGEKDVYYYATPIMAVHYAHLAMLAEEKDLPRTIADMVRPSLQDRPRAHAGDLLHRIPVQLHDSADRPRADDHETPRGIRGHSGSAQLQPCALPVLFLHHLSQVRQEPGRFQRGERRDSVTKGVEDGTTDIHAARKPCDAGVSRAVRLAHVFSNHPIPLGIEKNLVICNIPPQKLPMTNLIAYFRYAETCRRIFPKGGMRRHVGIWQKYCGVGRA